MLSVIKIKKPQNKTLQKTSRDEARGAPCTRGRRRYVIDAATTYLLVLCSVLLTSCGAKLTPSPLFDTPPTPMDSEVQKRLQNDFAPPAPTPPAQAPIIPPAEEQPAP